MQNINAALFFIIPPVYHSSSRSFVFTLFEELSDELEDDEPFDEEVFSEEDSCFVDCEPLELDELPELLPEPDEDELFPEEDDVEDEDVLFDEPEDEDDDVDEVLLLFVGAGVLFDEDDELLELCLFSDFSSFFSSFVVFVSDFFSDEDDFDDLSSGFSIVIPSAS